MTAKPLNDFVVDTMGSCFLCSRQIFPISSSIHSIQHLSRYLKMDLSKVFQVKGLIQQNLLIKVIKSQLKVSLCESCTSSNEKFSVLYRQLEKIQMAVMDCLELFKDNLEGALASCKDRTNGLLGMTDGSSEDEQWASSKMEIAQVLRKEAVQKCSRKLRSQAPRTKIQKLTSSQIQNEQIRIKSSFRKAAESVPFRASVADCEPEVEISCVKQEQESSFEDHGEWQDEWPENEDGFRLTLPPDQVKAPAEEKWRACSLEMETPKWRARRKTNFSKNATAPEHSKAKAIAPPLKIIGVAGNSAGQSTFNPTTAKYCCRQCPKEYNDERNFLIHFNRVHLQIQYKCSLCALLFPYKQNYDFHYLKQHAGVQIRCEKCNKTFARKWNLISHQRTAHLLKQGGSYGDSANVPPPEKIIGKAGKPKSTINPNTCKQKCDCCALEFGTYSGLYAHYRTAHLFERFRCPLCKKEFTQKAWYTRHYLGFHTNL